MQQTTNGTSLAASHPNESGTFHASINAPGQSTLQLTIGKKCRHTGDGLGVARNTTLLDLLYKQQSAEAGMPSTSEHTYAAAEDPKVCKATHVRQEEAVLTPAPKAVPFTQPRNLTPLDPNTVKQ